MDFKIKSGRTGRRRRKAARQKRMAWGRQAAQNLRGIRSWEVFDPDCGDLMSMQDFKEHVDSGCLIDYDGHGYYAARGRVSPVQVYPSTFKENVPGFTHVVWYNK